MGRGLSNSCRTATPFHESSLTHTQLASKDPEILTAAWLQTALKVRDVLLRESCALG